MKAKAWRGTNMCFMKANGIEPLQSFTAEQFDDVSGVNAGYIRTARELGIINGTGGNMFEPGRAAKRVEFYQIMKNMLDAGLSAAPDADTGKTSADFPDSADISGWAREATDELVRRGIILGDGGLDAQGGFNVGTLSAVLNRLPTA